MIDILLSHVRDILNQNFKNKYGVPDNKVIVSSLLDNSGSIPVELEDRIVCFLLSIEEETTLKNKASRSMGAGTGFLDKNSPLYLNLNLVFCANFKSKNYLEGLNYISQILNFFQNQKVLYPSSIPGISKRVEKITFDLCNLSYDNISQVWSAIGSKLLPAVIYKVGLVVLDDTPLKGITPAISSTDSESLN